MASDDMAAKFLAQLHCAFEVELAARAPLALGGAADRFARDINGEPAGSLVDDGQAYAGAGDRGAEVDRAGVVGGANDHARIAARFDGVDGSDVGDDTGKHYRRRS